MTCARGWRLGLLACAAVGIGACDPSGAGGVGGTIAELQAEIDLVNGATFTTATTIPANPPPALDIVVTNTQSAQSIYAATLVLPSPAPGAYNCPADFGITYTVAFTDTKTLVATAIINPNGCQWIQVIDGTSTLVTTVAASANPSYWGSLAAGLGIPESQIYPYTPPP